MTPIFGVFFGPYPSTHFDVYLSVCQVPWVNNIRHNETDLSALVEQVYMLLLFRKVNLSENRVLSRFSRK